VDLQLNWVILNIEASKSIVHVGSVAEVIKRVWDRDPLRLWTRIIPFGCCMQRGTYRMSSVYFFVGTQWTSHSPSICEAILHISSRYHTRRIPIHAPIWISTRFWVPKGRIQQLAQPTSHSPRPYLPRRYLLQRTLLIFSMLMKYAPRHGFWVLGYFTKGTLPNQFHIILRKWWVLNHELLQGGGWPIPEISFCTREAAHNVIEGIKNISAKAIPLSCLGVNPIHLIQSWEKVPFDSIIDEVINQRIHELWQTELVKNDIQVHETKAFSANTVVVGILGMGQSVQSSRINPFHQDIERRWIIFRECSNSVRAFFEATFEHLVEVWNLLAQEILVDVEMCLFGRTDI